MEAKIISKNSNSITIEIEIPISKSMLETEENIQKALNLVGKEATSYAISCFDTDGDPVVIDKLKYTSKGRVPKIYQTPYGEVEVERHVYQNSSGGKTFCPLDNSARIIVGSTPKFSKQVSSKYSEGGSKRVQVDLLENHGRYISRSYIQDISEAVGKGLLEKQETWNYTIPVEKASVSTIGISLDGTCMYIVGEGYRIGMVGTISLYDKEGERLYTHYSSSAPEYGKATFIENFEREIKRFKSNYPQAESVGIADGAKDNWQFLEKHTKCQILDFFHAREYITMVSDSVFHFKDEKKEWINKMAHILKHEQNGAREILKEFIDFRRKRLSDKKKEDLEKAITYFTNHLHQMNYNEYLANNYPIGSGVVEAACKVIIKQRLCSSGMKWKNDAANSVLCIRCYNYSDKKWSQAWDKINKYGLK